MSTIYDVLKIQKNIASQFSKLKIPDSVFNNATLQNLAKVQSQFNMCYGLGRNFAELLAKHQETLNSFSQQFSNSTFSETLTTTFSQNMNRIFNQLPNIYKRLDLDLNIPEINTNELIESINDLSHHIQYVIDEPTDIDLSYTAVMPADVESSKTFDWKFLIMFIISLLSLFIQISNTIDANNQSKENAEIQAKNIETQTKIVNILEQINDCLNDIEKTP
ncbi:hypothetical protein [Clostridium rectalis]|uniref:hypothetical protein n=1 Tax=Clostridium rectalis TaxID=2040295 RepID=UPI000F6446C5|nr:hypothetical protein [Clostridium rectalis]